MNDKHKLLATKLASLLLLGIVLTIFPGIIISTAIDNGITAPVTGVAVIVFGLATTSLSYIFGKQLKLTNHPRTPYNLFSLNPSYMNEDTERVRTETVPTTTPKQEVVIPIIFRFIGLTNRNVHIWTIYTDNSHSARSFLRNSSLFSCSVSSF